MADIPNDPPCPKIDEKCTAAKLICLLKAFNRRSPINKLPSEILSRIFATGEKAERIWRQNQPAEESYVSFLERVSHTCSHWRDVAINDPTLWTYIHVTCPPSPGQIVSIYLARAGPTALLDIILDMRQKYFDRAGIKFRDYYGQDECFWNIMVFLISHNAGIARWRSLQIRTLHWLLLFAPVTWINCSGAPALRYISWQREAPAQTIIQETVFPIQWDEYRYLSASSIPNLEVLESGAVPWQLLFEPIFTGYPCLTVVSLSAGINLFPPSTLCEFLSVHPQLEVLTLSTGTASFQDFGLASKRVCLPSLRSLSIRTIAHISWVICILHMIDAPVLRQLELYCPRERFTTRGFSDRIATYIATGQTSLDDSISSLAETPFYPSLRELDISFFTSCSRNKLVEMLASLPHITHLCVRGLQAACLGKAPWLCPNLISLRFTHSVYGHLGNVLRCRVDAGIPIKVVLFPKDLRLYVKDKLPHTVEIQEYDDDL